MNTAIRLSFALVLALVAVACMDPQGRRPGLRLAGDVVRETPSDWSFTNAYKEIAIEVNTPYLVPHSVTIWCGVVNGRLYIGARNPDTKRWPGWVDRAPDVRLGIGEQIYEARLAPIDDSNQIEQIRSAYARKYELADRRPGAGPPIRYWLVEPRG